MTQDSRIFYVYAFLRSKPSTTGSKYSPYYIGKGIRHRAFKNTSRRCPIPADKSYIVFIQEGLTEEEAFSLEKYCIALYGRIDLGTGILRNLTDGGDGSSGWRPSQETRNKMSQSRVGKPLPQKVKNNMSRALLGNQRWLGKQHTESTKRKMSQSSQRYLYEFTDSSGEIYITDNASEFAEQYGLSDGHLNQVIHGKRTHHKGWTGRILEALSDKVKMQ